MDLGQAQVKEVLDKIEIKKKPGLYYLRGLVSCWVVALFTKSILKFWKNNKAM